MTTQINSADLASRLLRYLNRRPRWTTACTAARQRMPDALESGTATPKDQDLYRGASHEGN